MKLVSRICDLAIQYPYRCGLITSALLAVALVTYNLSPSMQRETAWWKLRALVHSGDSWKDVKQRLEASSLHFYEYYPDSTSANRGNPRITVYVRPSWLLTLYVTKLEDLNAPTSYFPSGLIWDCTPRISEIAVGTIDVETSNAIQKVIQVLGETS